MAAFDLDPGVAEALLATAPKSLVVLPRAVDEAGRHVYPEDMIDAVKVMRDEGIDVGYLADDPEARLFKSEYSSLTQQLSENVVFGILGNFGYDLIKAFASFYWTLARDTGKGGTIRIARISTKSGSIEGLSMDYSATDDIEALMAGLSDLIGDGVD
jgi:hypothetical protein